MRSPTRVPDVLCLAALGGAAVALASFASGAPGERANRTMCANNLRQIHIAAVSYMDDQSGRTKYLPHVHPLTEPDGPAESERAFEMLVQYGYIDDCAVFVCPSSSEEVRELTDSERANLRTFAGFEGDGLQSRQLSYGWSRAARSASSRSDVPLAADKAVRLRGGPPEVGNHPSGRNAVFFGGYVEWVPAADEARQRQFAAELNLIAQDLSAAAQEAVSTFPLAAGEEAAIRALYRVFSAEVEYHQTDPDDDGLVRFGSADEIDLPSEPLAGYVLELGQTSRLQFEARARPEPAGSGSGRSFSIDERGVLRFSAGGIAGRDSAPVPELDIDLSQREEVEALGSILWVVAAEEEFRARDADGDGTRDYGSLEELGRAGLIDAALASGERSGLAFSMVRAEADRWAVRVTSARLGDRGEQLFADHTGIIRESHGRVASERSRGIIDRPARRP